MRDQDKKKVKWNSVLSIEDISPRRKQDFIYILLYTNLGVSVCTSESIGQRLCLFQPYEMKGYVNFCKGGTFLVLEKAKEVQGENFQETHKSQGPKIGEEVIGTGGGEGART